MEQNLNEMINVKKREYEYLKQFADNYIKLSKSDFFLKIKKGLVVPKEHPNYYNGRVDIEIYNENSYFIQIEGKSYSIDSILFSKIKNTIENYIEKLIYFSKLETQQYLMENAYEGGSPSSIILKYGQLIINLNGQVFGEIGDLCNEIKDNIVNLILNNSIEELKLERSNEMNDELKVNDNIQFNSEETQQEFSNYIDEINEYNRKIKNGEETDVNPGDLLNKYREKFYDEELENKMKKIDNQKENFKFENNETDEMLNKIDQKILELDEEYKD